MAEILIVAVAVFVGGVVVPVAMNWILGGKK